MIAAEPRRGIRLVKRMYRPRIIGPGLGSVMVAGALYQIGVPMWVWVLLALNGFAWPHVAYLTAVRSNSPYFAEHRNLLIDSASGGFWVVAMGFNLLPSVLALTMLSMGNVAIGGSRLFYRGLLASLAGGLLAWPLLGGRVELATSLYVIVASIPFMVTYPFIIGVISYRLSQQLSQQKQEMEALSQRDALSGLATRGFWEVRLDQEFRRWQRHGRPAALILADIDHFKRVNDTYGHLVGDQVIRSIGQMLNLHMRVEDIVGRYGGEEFGAILPDTTVVGAQLVAQRIQHALADLVVPGDLKISLTISIGISALSPQVAEAREWVRQADLALYRAKNSGRNCIRVFEDSAPSAASA